MQPSTAPHTLFHHRHALLRPGRLVAAVLLAGLVMLAGCAGSNDESDDNGGSVSTSDLEGTWRGTIKYFTGSTTTVGNVTVSVSGSNFSVTSPLGTFGGSIAHEQGSIFGFELSDGTEGGFFVDDNAEHAAFLDEEENFGVVEKGANALDSSATNFSIFDMIASWSGRTVEVDALLNIQDVYDSSATVDDALNISGSNKYGNFSGAIDQSFDVNYGFAVGNVDDGVLVTYLTPDAQFAGSYNCEPGATSFLTECVFSAWWK